MSVSILSKRQSKDFQLKLKDLENQKQDLKKANADNAQQFYMKWRMNKAGNLIKLNCDNSELAPYGVGLQLFFDLIKTLRFVYFLMALIALIPMYSNFTGDGLDKAYTQPIQIYNRFCLANQPQFNFTSVDQNASEEEKEKIQKINDVAAIDFQDIMEHRENFVVLPDILYSLIFIMFIRYWKKRSKEIKNDSLYLKATPSYYTVYIKNIPRDFTDEDKLAEHFERFGQIQEAKIVRDYGGRLYDHKKIVDLKYKIAVENEMLRQDPSRKETEIKKLEAKLSEAETKLAYRNANKFGRNVSHQKYPAIGAYIVFNDRVDRIKCLKIFKRANSWFGSKPKICYLNGKLLQLDSKVDEPSNIKWENLDATKWDIFQRQCCVIMIIIMIMMITFTVIMMANIVKPTNTDNCPSSQVTYEFALENKDDQTAVECYCKTLSSSEILDNAEKKEFCWDSYVKYMYLIFLSVLFATAVSFVNYSLKAILRKLGNFNKYPSITQQTTGVTISLFLAMFTNTAILTLLFQGDIFGFKPSVAVSQPIPALKEIQEQKAKEFSNDFDRSWYTQVGVKIIYAMTFNMIYPHLCYFCVLPWLRKQRKKKAETALLQKDMNQYMLGMPFSVTQYYAIMLNTTFVTLLYSSGMPILLWFGFISLTIQYKVYKYLLLRYNKRPPSYDHRLNKKIINILPYAIVLHLMFGIYKYTSPLIFPKSTDTIKNTISEQLGRTDGGTDLLFSHSAETQTLFARVSGQPLMLTLLIIIALVSIFDKTIGLIWEKLKKCCCGKKNQVHVVSKRFKTYTLEYESMNKRLLASYDINQNQDYSELISAIEENRIKRATTLIENTDSSDSDDSEAEMTPGDKQKQLNKSKQNDIPLKKPVQSQKNLQPKANFPSPQPRHLRSQKNLK